MLNYGEGSTPVPASSNNRNRRAGSAGEQRFTCSQQSVLSAIDRFVKAINNMDATVLVPSRLRDMEVQNRWKTNSARPPPPGLQHQDLYSFYSMLKDVKNELLWGPSIVGTSLFSSSLSGMSSPRTATSRGGTTTPLMMSPMMTMPMMPMMTGPQLRQPSDDGLGSSTGCSSDQDTDSDFESIMTDRESMIMEQTSHLATAFRHHLHGLHAILHQLADSADYLANRYQEEIDSPMP